MKGEPNVAGAFRVMHHARGYKPVPIYVSRNFGAVSVALEEHLERMVNRRDRVMTIDDTVVIHRHDSSGTLIGESHVWIEYPEWYLSGADVPQWCIAPLGAPQ